jgi:putative Holliday junction resolvase
MMGRIVAIDYGLKRTGVAVTDPLQMIATPLETVLTNVLMEWLKSYIPKENVEVVVVGIPTKLDQSPTHSTEAVYNFIDQLHKAFPSVNVEQEDERFTSRMALQSMIDGGMKKKDRRKKANVDKISAAIILQSYLKRTNR